MGIAFCTNMITLFFFMELLTIIPLYFIMALFGYSDYIKRTNVALMCLFWGVGGATFFLIGQKAARYPELVWLDRYPYLLPTLLAVVPCYLLAGWSGVIVGFCWSTTLIYHVTFAINSVAHGPGTRRYLTGDDSRNTFLLALLSLGEGWHNNHHAYPNSTRQGFRPGEIDITYHVLRLLARVGIVWELREPPEDMLRNERRPGRRASRRAASLLLEDLSVGPGAPRPTRQALQQRARMLYPEVSEAHLETVVEHALREVDALPRDA